MQTRNRHEHYLRGFMNELEQERYEAVASRDYKVSGELQKCLVRGHGWDPEMMQRARAILAVSDAFAGVAIDFSGVAQARYQPALPNPSIVPEPSAAPVVRLVNTIIVSALEEGASQVEIAPTLAGVCVAIEIGVVRRELMNVPREMLTPIIARLKALADVDPETTGEQRGIIPLQYRSRLLDVEARFMPSGDGESAVLHVVRESA